MDLEKQGHQNSSSVVETKLGCMYLIWLRNRFFEVLIVWIAISMENTSVQFAVPVCWTGFEMFSPNDYILILSWEDLTSVGKKQQMCSKVIPRKLLLKFRQKKKKRANLSLRDPRIFQLSSQSAILCFANLIFCQNSKSGWFKARKLTRNQKAKWAFIGRRS